MYWQHTISQKYSKTHINLIQKVVSENAGVQDSGCWLQTSGWAWLQWSWSVITSVFSDRETPFSSSPLLCWWNAAMSEGNAERTVRRGIRRFFCKCSRKTVRKEERKRKRNWSMPNGILNEVWEEHSHNPVNHRSHSCDNPSDILPQPRLHISISITYSLKWQIHTVNISVFQTDW